MSLMKMRWNREIAMETLISRTVISEAVGEGEGEESLADGLAWLF